MKKTIQTLIAVAALGAFSLAARAQPAPKVLIVDIAKLYDGHYKTADYMAKLQEDDKKAQDQLEQMNKDGNAVVEEYKAISDQATNNPALTPEKKNQLAADAQKKMDDIQRRRAERDKFFQDTRNALQQRLNNFRSLLLDEIAKTATEVAKRKGATLLLDKSGPTAWNIPGVLYYDPAYEITDEVLAEINKSKPAASAVAPTSAPATAAPAAAAPAAGSGGITLPGLNPTKKP